MLGKDLLWRFETLGTTSVLSLPLLRRFLRWLLTTTHLCFVQVTTSARQIGWRNGLRTLFCRTFCVTQLILVSYLFSHFFSRVLVCNFNRGRRKVFDWLDILRIFGSASRFCSLLARFIDLIGSWDRSLIPLIEIFSGLKETIIEHFDWLFNFILLHLLASRPFGFSFRFCLVQFITSLTFIQLVVLVFSVHLFHAVLTLTLATNFLNLSQ